MTQVLITGGAGFIGSSLAARLHSEGFEVRILDNLHPQIHGIDPRTTSGTLAKAEEHAEVMIGSVLSREAMSEALEGCEVVVHLAAETGTGQSMYEVDRYSKTNIGGTSLLLDIVSNSTNSVRKIVVASSRSIYGEGRYETNDGQAVFPGHRGEIDLEAGRFEVTYPGVEGPLRLVGTDEGATIHPSSVYAITKQTQEQLVMTVCPSVGIAPVALRYQNVYGPGQSLSNPYTGILSIFSGQILQGNPINIFEDGMESRDFVYIDDVVDATYRAITSDRADGHRLNVGSGVPVSVLEVVDALMDAYGKRVDTSVTGNFRLGDIRHNFADLTKIRELLGFEPTVDFADGLKRFASWVVSQPQTESAYDKSLQEMRTRNLLK